MPTEITKLSEEFVKYQLLRQEDIPVSVWQEALLVSAEGESDRALPYGRNMALP